METCGLEAKRGFFNFWFSWHNSALFRRLNFDSSYENLKSSVLISQSLDKFYHFVSWRDQETLKNTSTKEELRNLSYLFQRKFLYYLNVGALYKETKEPLFGLLKNVVEFEIATTEPFSSFCVTAKLIGVKCRTKSSYDSLRVRTNQSKHFLRSMKCIKFFYFLHRIKNNLLLQKLFFWLNFSLYTRLAVCSKAPIRNVFLSFDTMIILTLNSMRSSRQCRDI